ncbi:hypothetical protein PO902_14145 [Planococcus maritimus]|nr:hypothetical protein [Planococcus sp. SK3692]MDE4086184.1 hypothetical protein [Planococcus maritimus]
MQSYLNDRMLVISIEAHKRIIAEGENVDLAEIGYEVGTPFDSVKTYNSFTILSILEFPIEEATNPEGKAAKLLDSISKENTSVEDIIAALIEFRNVEATE